MACPTCGCTNAEKGRKVEQGDRFHYKSPWGEGDVIVARFRSVEPKWALICLNNGNLYSDKYAQSGITESALMKQHEFIELTRIGGK